MNECHNSRTAPFTAYKNVIIDPPPSDANFVWLHGPAGPWPALDPLEEIIDEINHNTTPTPATDKSYINGQVAQNMPPTSDFGFIHVPNDLPKRWCWVKVASPFSSGSTQR